MRWRCISWRRLLSSGICKLRGFYHEEHEGKAKDTALKNIQSCRYSLKAQAQFCKKS